MNTWFISPASFAAYLGLSVASQRTLTIEAPADAYARARSPASSFRERDPALGLRNFTSAMRRSLVPKCLKRVTSFTFAVYRPSSHVNLYSNGNLMPPIVDAARVYATEQEICDVLREVFGTHTDRAEF